MNQYYLFDNLKSIVFLTENFEELTINAKDVTYTDIHDYNDEDRCVGEINLHKSTNCFQHLTIKIKNNTKCYWKQFEAVDNFDAIKRFSTFMDITSVTFVYEDDGANELPIYWSNENAEFARLDHDLYQKHYYEVVDGKLTGNYCLEFVTKMENMR